MAETVKVYMSGPTLSFMLHETMKSELVQVGFLLGELIERKTSTITDNDQRQVNVAKEIHITSSIPVMDPFLMYSPTGKIDSNWITEFLGRLAQKVIGWYVFQPQISNTMSFRERVVHCQLARLLQKPQDLFTCCLMTNERNDNASTHNLGQIFLRHWNYNTELIPMHVSNLNDPNNTYKVPTKTSDNFKNLVSELKIEDNLSNGLGCIVQIQNAMQNKMDHMAMQLATLEEEMFALEKEVIDAQNRSVLSDLMGCEKKEEEEFEAKKEFAEMPRTRGRGKRGKNI